MQSQKVIVDTNVIVAASIIENISGLDVPVKHEFYDQSIRLFSIFKKQPQERIGIAVPTVKREAFKVLTRAVKSVFLNGISNDRRVKQHFYDAAVAIINSSESKMRDLFVRLIAERPPEWQIQRNLQIVNRMSNDISNTWNKQYKQKYQRIRQSQKRAKPITTEKYWKDEQKEEVFYTHTEQVHVESIQIERFMKKFPNPMDSRILAETISVKEKYCKMNEDYVFFIASCDTGFFSPYIAANGAKSDKVTKEIHNRFKITCDHPQEIYGFIGGYTLESPQTNPTIDSMGKEDQSI